MRSQQLSAFVSMFVLAVAAAPSGARGQVVYVPQGPDWSSAKRSAFYVGDQGSQMIPLAWMQALKQQNGKPFLAESLSRYRYLPNPVPGNPANLPVGFTVASSTQRPMLGMTCSACHTREITADGKSYRVDGGPAIVDFQSLLSDLDKSVLDALATDSSFQSFAQAVLGTKTPSPTAVAILRADVTLWSTRFHVLMSKALPKTPWGPSRLDAVSMIYNRLTGLDLGPKPLYLIPDNIQVADAPTRYPFLWNAPKQSMTQWPGFAANGSDILGLSRNLGEVYGIFATFHPEKAEHLYDLINRYYNKDNSANYYGLTKLEKLVDDIGAPVWPWPVDEKMAERGKAIFDRPGLQGCVGCHGQTKGPTRIGRDPIFNKTWETPVLDVGTDVHEAEILYRTADSGSLASAKIPFLTNTLCQKDLAINVLATSVLGGIIQYYAPGLQATAPVLVSRAGVSPQVSATADGANLQAVPVHNESLPTADASQREPGVRLALSLHQPGHVKAILRRPSQPPQPTPAYESRVLYGIWAAAPYLHNGSVPTLAELLKPSALRVKSFKIGPAYDPVNVGLAKVQTKFDYTLVTTGCNDLSSGNSNCGHEYGTTLSDAEKKDLLEYLKVIKPAD